MSRVAVVAVLFMLGVSCAAQVVQVTKSEPKGPCGKSIVVIGAVAFPGKFDVRETPTLLQAIDRAGGFTVDAGKDDVVVERCSEDRSTVFRVASTRAMRGGVGDLALQNGDIVHVPTL